MQVQFVGQNLKKEAMYFVQKIVVHLNMVATKTKPLNIALGAQ
jgi:hypothetical protein